MTAPMTFTARASCACHLARHKNLFPDAGIELFADGGRRCFASHGLGLFEAASAYALTFSASLVSKVGRLGS